MIELKLEKCQATLITSLAKSNPEVAELAMERDIAESAYYTCISATENLRLEAEILRTKVAWLRTELKNS
jgi:capsule polysaccharide export protein KpsE/RkpR